MPEPIHYHIAIDWGATSGRVIVAQVQGQKIDLLEVHRFAHAMYQGDDGHWHWDYHGLLEQTINGLYKAATLGHHYESIGVDTWGVDVAFFDDEGQLLTEPLAYRDPFTTAVPKLFYQYMSAAALYSKTGIQQMHFNTVFKLFGCRLEQYRPFMEAKHILFLPDAVGYFLTDRMVCEFSSLSTSAMMDPNTKDLDDDILRLCGLQREQFPEVVFPGHELGTLRPDILNRTGLNPDCRVVTVAGHDTASAVAAVPRSYEGLKVAYLSSGTWSLMGTVTDAPVITTASRKLNFTNEGGVGGTIRLLKNITGMWILEQCRNQWAKHGKIYSHEQLVCMAQTVTHIPELFNPDEARFANPVNMIDEVKSGRTMTDAQVVACIFHSLAHRYGEVFAMLQSLLPERLDVLYIIGGGARNDYLNQLTRQAVGVPVIVGSCEATTVGNIRIQSNIL